MAQEAMKVQQSEDPDLSAEDQRDRTRGANRALALLLVGGAALMLAAAFGVALLVTHG